LNKQTGADADLRKANMASLMPVPAGLLQRKCACGGSPGVDGECTECRAKRLSIQRRATTPSATSPTVPPIVHDVLSSSGQPLDATTQAFMAPRFGHDFSNVRVHTDARAAESALAVNALAYTVGRDVVFGAGQYAPRTSEGRRLMAHELTHVVQQGNLVQRRSGDLEVTHPTDVAEQQAQHAADAVMNAESFTLTPQEIGKVARTSKKHPHVAPKDPETALGERLLGDFPTGVKVALYHVRRKEDHKRDREAERKAKEWAAREHAIGPKHTKIQADELAFGKAIADTLDLEDTLNAIGSVLQAAVAKVSTAPDAARAAKIQTLALFAHSYRPEAGETSKGLALEESTSPFVLDNVELTIKSISSVLAPDVKIVLYSCSLARGSNEDAEDEYKGTWEGGGADSLAGKTRDALVHEGKGQSEVWGHTIRGHTTRNFTLREFKAASGEGSEGISYLDTYVFGANERKVFIDEITEAAQKIGHLADEKQKDDFMIQADREIKMRMYQIYVGARHDTNILPKHKGGTMAELAPLYPVEVAEVVRKRWKVYWTTHKKSIINNFIKRSKSGM
jgi:hypothetical protein